MPSVSTEGRAGKDRAKASGKQWQPQRFRADVEDGVGIGYERDFRSLGLVCTFPEIIHQRWAGTTVPLEELLFTAHLLWARLFV